MAQITNIDSTRSSKDPDHELDLRLIRRIAGKDSAALSEFYDRHSRYLYTIIYYMVKDEAEAEDLLQEVFLLIWEKAGSYDESLGNPLAWVTRITRNKAIDRLRSKGFRKRASETDIERFFDLSEESDTNDPEKNSSRSQESSEIRKALQSLSDNQRDLIEYAYFGGFSQSELAKHFNIPLGTVKTRMRSAMMALREKLKHLL